MTKHAPVTDRPRAIQDEPVPAFPSTIVMISTLFAAALFSILYFDHLYSRLTEVEGFDKEAWEGWSSFMQTTLGLGMTVAGVVATVWIAFRVESIARRQLANDDRDQDLALLRFDVIEPAKASTGPFFEALSRNRKASYLIQKIETDLDNWHYRMLHELYPLEDSDGVESATSIDLICRKCNLQVREEKAESAIEMEVLARKEARTRPFKQVLRRSFIDMYSVLDNQRRGSDVDPLDHIPDAQREELADHVEAYIDFMWSREDLSQSTENFVNSLRRRVEAMGEKGTTRPTRDEAPALFFEICAYHEGQDLERNTPKGGEADPLASYDDAFWRTKFLNSQSLPESFEVGFHINEITEVAGNMAQVLEMSLLAGVHSEEAFDARFDRYVASKNGVLKPDTKTRLLCWSEYRSALTRDVDGLTKSIILDAMHRSADDVPELSLRRSQLSPNDFTPSKIEQEDANAIELARFAKTSLDTCRCPRPQMALGD